MTTKFEKYELSDGLVEAYWILCEPAEVVSRAIQEFTHFAKQGRPFMYGDDEVSAEQMLDALSEVIDYFTERGIWPVENSVA